jgi:hypothetical protein
MTYIVEYEVVNNKICGVVKDSNTGTPVHLTGLYDSHQAAAAAVQGFITQQTQTSTQEAAAPTSRCCGR